MALIQPYFQPDLDPSMPAFATFWNGFMQERSAMNMLLMKQFFNDATPAFLDAQIKESSEAIKRLDEARIKMAEMNKKEANKFLIGSMKTSVAAQKATATARMQLLGHRSGMDKTYLNALKAKGNVDKLARKRLALQQGLLANPGALEGFFAMVTNEGSEIGGGNKYTTMISLIEGGWDASDLEAVMDPIINRAIGSFGKDSYSRSDGPTQKMYTAEVMRQVESYLLKGKKNFEALSETNLSGTPLIPESGEERYSRFLNLVNTQLGMDLSEASREGRVQQFSEYGNKLTDLTQEQIAEAYLKISKKRPHHENLNRLQQELKVAQARTYAKIPDPAKKREAKTRNKGKIARLKAKIKDQKSFLYAGASDPLRDERIIEATKAVSPVLWSSLTGKPVPEDPNLVGIEKRLKEEQAILEGLRIKRAAAYEEAMQGPSRFFRFFEKNYLLETPFKRPTPAARLSEAALKGARERMTTPTGAKSTVLNQLDLGRPYRVPGGVWVGMTAQEQPFYKTGPNRPPKVVMPEDNDYDYVTNVLKKLNAQIKKAGLSQ